jgi:DNA primase
VNGKINCAEARRINLVDYLHQLGYMPEKVSGGEYWYLSPLRVETNPSFKVDTNRNIWYDHGLGKGGTLIDFGLLFHKCSLPSLLNILSGTNDQAFSFHPPLLPTQKNRQQTELKLEIIKAEPLVNHSLLAYVLRRGVSLEVAGKYLQQITYRTAEREFTALGFKNNAGGYELRSVSFKGSSSPKDSTLIMGSKTAHTLVVFEGMFSFLSYLEIKESLPAFTEKMNADEDPVLAKPESDYLVLNSLAFLEKRREMMEHYSKINLYLDSDKAGVEATQKALHWSEKYKDKSFLYNGHKDLNDYLVHLKKQKLQQEQKKNIRQRKTI